MRASLSGHSQRWTLQGASLSHWPLLFHPSWPVNVGTSVIVPASQHLQWATYKWRKPYTHIYIFECLHTTLSVTEYNSYAPTRTEYTIYALSYLPLEQPIAVCPRLGSFHPTALAPSAPHSSCCYAVLQLAPGGRIAQYRGHILSPSTRQSPIDCLY